VWSYPRLVLDVPSLGFYLTAAVLVGSLVLGGGTRSGFLSDAFLQLLTLPVLIHFLWRLFAGPLPQHLKVALSFCLALAALPLLQLVPLPPWLWTRLPNNDASTAFEITGQAVHWMPLSVAPQATLLVLLSLIPPLAVFLGAVQLSYRERRWLSLVLIGVGIVSVFLGLIQVAQGPASGLRFFEITNPSEAVGFFANRNHFAALIYCVMVFAVAWTLPAATDVGTKLSQWQFDVASILKALAVFTILVMLLAGETMARSRAGLALTIVALFGALALGFAYQTGVSFRPPSLRERFRIDRLLSFSATKLLAAAIALTLVFSLQYALYRIQERFEADPVDDARLVFIPNTIEAAKAYLPFGSGLGTFVSVYPLFEKPEGTLANTYANHAHNDAAEVALETGIFGLVLMGLFVIWLAYRSAAMWTGPIPRGAGELDQTLARAATIVIGLLLAHSLVDYPLRTGAMMAVMAFACALLIPPSTAEEPSTAHAREDAHFPVASGVPAPRLPSARGNPAKAQDVPATGKRQWGSDINWPKEWSNQTKLPGEDDPPRK
jgi:O-antigen ligase